MSTSPSRIAARPRLVRIADADDGVARFAEDVRAGLSASAKTLPCRYFYDAAGSELFEQICDLPEYYLTRTEDAILRASADAMVEGWFRPPVIVELGSGSSAKTRRLLAAAIRAYGDLHYVPIDVSPTILEDSAHALTRAFPGLRVTGYAADYRSALTRLAARIRRPKLFVFLGSSIGNYETNEAVALLSLISGLMTPADRLLLGTDLDKDRATLEAAYDDARGVSARFNLNILARINRDLGGDFAPGRFRHRATYNAAERRVEMRLESTARQVVRIPGAGLTVRFEPGETIHTENSHKYTTGSLADLARRSGLAEEAAWTDDRGLFRVQRWRPS